MGRKKIKIAPLLDERNQNVTFNKRKGGLMKKAYELSVLCECDIALIIFNNKKETIHEYSNNEMGNLLLRYSDSNAPIETITNKSFVDEYEIGSGNYEQPPSPLEYTEPSPVKKGKRPLALTIPQSHATTEIPNQKLDAMMLTQGVTYSMESPNPIIASNSSPVRSSPILLPSPTALFGAPMVWAADEKGISSPWTNTFSWGKGPSPTNTNYPKPEEIPRSVQLQPITRSPNSIRNSGNGKKKLLKS